MVFSVFASTGVVANAALAKNFLTVSNTGFVNGKVTYTVSLASGIKVEGAIIDFKYNKDVLKVVDADGVYTIDPDSNKLYNVTGEYVAGENINDKSVYSFAYISSGSFNTGTTGKQFVYITFEVISANRPVATVEVSCNQFRSDAYNIEKSAAASDKLIVEDDILTLDNPTAKSIYSAQNGVVFSWNAVIGAASYTVYRRLGDGEWLKLASDITASSYVDAKAVSGKTYSYSVAASDGTNLTGYDKKGLSLTYMKLAISNATTGVKIQWPAFSGATGYIVYRKPVSGSYSRITKTALSKNTLTYTDTGAASNTNYIYLVRAFVSSKKYYDAVNEGFTYIAAPTTKLSNVYGGINVSWGAVPGATAYRVYRKAAGESSWTIMVNSTTAKSYTDKSGLKNGTKYYYTVAAYKGSIKSAYKTVALKYFAAPKVTLSNASNGITLKWSKIAGATKYYVYRMNGTSWKRIATVTSLSYTDKSVSAGKNYKYTLRAYDGKNLSGFYTSGWTIRFLTVPKLSSATSSKSGITVKWGRVSGASGYIVYRKTGSGSWKTLAKAKGNSAVSYLDKTAKKGTTYTYTVRAYYSSYRSTYNTRGISCKDKY